MKPRKIPAPLTVEEIPGGNRVDETEGKAHGLRRWIASKELPAAGHLRQT